MSDDLTRLAKILFNNLNPGIRWTELDKKHYENAAKTLIIAMREPTENQYNALANRGEMWKELNSYTVWTTYIDALVNDK